MHKVVPFLWFNDNAEQAANFYITLFKNSRITNVMRNGATVMAVNFELDGQPVYTLNGGPQFKFTEAFSMFVSCETQQEIDDLWSQLTANGGQESQCGWLKDRFGLSWQIIPTVLGKLLGDKDPARSGRAMQAMLQMRKLDIARLQAAADGR
jgi:predicted 3-demethylubiquinone-9 3-methyltransferase (glyoxalase superfamily)